MAQEVIFDWDDTLVNTKGSKFPAIIETGRQLGLTITPTNIEAHWNNPYQQMLKNVLVGGAGDVVALYEKVTQDFPMQAFPDSLDVLKVLTKRLRVGILSSGSRSLIMRDMQRLKFPWEDITVQGSEDTPIHKPNPAVFGPILKLLDIHNPTEAVYVGNSLLDYEAATRAGLRFYGIVREPSTVEMFKTVQANTITSLSQLPDVLRIA